ncbi:MAG: LysR family transcriptional regulator [Ruminococcaceae bacterium]|nr:LysR family transcriptional regulator [Oscillospiraceae bacterium]
MKAITKITIVDENGEKFFGEGPARLLRAVEDTGSLRSAALSMQMSYSKAHKIISHAEEVLGFPLTYCEVGGKHGGGSRITAEGKEWLEKYEEFRDACCEANRRIYMEYFPQQR